MFDNNMVKKCRNEGFEMLIELRRALLVRLKSNKKKEGTLSSFFFGVFRFFRSLLKQ